MWPLWDAPVPVIAVSSSVRGRRHGILTSSCRRAVVAVAVAVVVRRRGASVLSYDVINGTSRCGADGCSRRRQATKAGV